MTHRVRRFAFPALASLSLYSFLAAAPLEAVEATCANPGSGSVIKNHKWECPLIWLTGLTQDAAGRLAIDWEGRDPEKSRGAYRRRYDELGNPIGGEMLVHPPLNQ